MTTTAKGKRNNSTVGRRHCYGARNLPYPPTSSGRLLAIQVPKPKTWKDLKGMVKTYLPDWNCYQLIEGGFCICAPQPVGYTVLRTFEELIEQVHTAMKEAVTRGLAIRVKKEVEQNPSSPNWKKQQDSELEERERRRRETEGSRIRAEHEAQRRSREGQQGRQSRFWERPCYSPWQVLGVAPYAPMEAIKRAYRDLAKECHPDLCAQNGLDIRTATRAFQILATAREEALALQSV